MRHTLYFCGEELGTYKKWEVVDENEDNYHGFLPVERLWKTSKPCTMLLYKVSGVIEFRDKKYNLLKTTQLKLVFENDYTAKGTLKCQT